MDWLSERTADFPQKNQAGVTRMRRGHAGFSRPSISEGGPVSAENDNQQSR
jgi:hypothetical protein